uniref:Uncharacterized protein n=1 Tax=Daphnia galeata TaxID=27404 RepID=A0A8J2RJV2_9CRUS|nr:unnamed protein product [Daphnia galeata]
MAAACRLVLFQRIVQLSSLVHHFPNEIEGSDHPDLTEAEASRNLSDSFHVETSVANDLLSCSDCDETFKKMQTTKDNISCNISI